MRLMTWNINGLRSLKSSLKPIFDSFECDIICLQETKVDREHLESQYEIVEGYNSYFSFSRVKSGYSGVAIFTKNAWTPWKSEDTLSGVCLNNTQNLNGINNHEDCIGGFGEINETFSQEELIELDSEGRCVITQHKIIDCSKVTRDLVIINVYCPRADEDDLERLKYKLNFYKLLQIRAETLFHQGNLVIILGDINTSHKRIDHCNPDGINEFERNASRRWMDNLLIDASKTHENKDKFHSFGITEKEVNSHIIFHDHQSSFNEMTDQGVDGKKIESKGGCFVDMLRVFHPTTAHLFTNWCSSTGARQTNYGSRLDYILCDKILANDLNLVSSCDIRPDIQGSDHCPVEMEINVESLPSHKCPRFCSKFYPQFSGRQLKLGGFLTKNTNKQFFETETKLSRLNDYSNEFSCNVNKTVLNTANQSKLNSFNSLQTIVKSIVTNTDKTNTVAKNKKIKCKLKKIKIQKEQGLQLSMKHFVLKKSIQHPNQSTQNDLNLSNFSASLQQSGELFDSTEGSNNLNGSIKEYCSPIVDDDTYSDAEKESSFCLKENTSKTSSHVTNTHVKLYPETSISQPFYTTNIIKDATTTATTQPFFTTTSTQLTTNKTQSKALYTTQSITSTKSTTATFSSTTTQSITSTKSTTTLNKTAWKQLLKGPPDPPLCSGHKELCLLRVVKKEGDNLGRRFWVCRKPPGHKGDPQARCNTFLWLK